MKKIKLTDISGRLYTLSGQDGRTTLSRIGKQGQLCLKKFEPDYITGLANLGIDIEKKILDSQTFAIPKEIVSPSAVVYSLTQEFTGYCMPYIDGKTLREYARNFLSLEETTDIYKRLERLVKVSDDFVFPDLSTFDNILVSSKGIRLIDYDGIQTGQHKSTSVSLNLYNSPTGIQEKIMGNKKYCVDGVFTKNLDKRSLAFLYMILAFGINLGDIAAIPDEHYKRIVLKGLFQLQGLENTGLESKIENMLFSDTDDEYIGSEVTSIGKNYTLKLEKQFSPTGKSVLLKKLTPKK